MSKDITTLRQELSAALKYSDSCLVEYKKAVAIAADRAEELAKASKLMMSMPNIQIEDFEIDN